MGKVLKVVAIVVAVAVIVFAPVLLPGLLATIGITSAIATALIATALMVGASVLLRTLTAPKPSASMATAPLHSYPQGTAIVRGGIASGVGLPPVTQRTMKPKRDHWFRHFDRWGLGRFHIIRVSRDCLAPLVPDGSFCIIDIEAEIREGDLFEFNTRDRERVWPRAIYGRIKGVVKRFRGIDPEAGFLECECFRPAHVIHTGLTNLRWAHRVRALAATWEEAQALLRAVRRDPGAYDERLAA